MNPLSFLKNNLQFLQSEERLLGISKEILSQWEEPSREREKILDELFLCAQNNSSLTIEKNGHFYHSRRDSDQEARRAISALQKSGARHLLMVGSGLGHIPALALDEFMESIFLIEPDEEILFFLLSIYNWQKKNIYILHKEQNNEKGLDCVLFFLRGKTASAVEIYFHRPSLSAKPELYSAYQIRLPQLLQTRHVNQNTLIKFQEVWNRNIFLNLSLITQSHTLNHLLSFLKELRKKNEDEQNALPFVIAGAGPSLSLSIPILKKERDKFLLIATDTAFIPLAECGIYADITLSVDPQWLNHYFLSHAEISRSLWLLDPAVCYANGRRLQQKGAQVFWWNNPFYLDQVVREICGERGNISHGGSVSTNAFDLSVQAGAREIILVGQDLSYPQKVAHVKGSVLEAAIFLKNNRFATMENHNYRQMNSFSPRYVNSMEKNKTVLTSEKMQVFIRWFEERGLDIAELEKQNRRENNFLQHDIRLINAGAQGVHLRGFEHLDIRTFLRDKKSFSHLELLENAKKFCADSCARKKNICQENLYKKIQEICHQSEELLQGYQENFLLSRTIAQTKNPSPKQLEKLNHNDALSKKYAQTSKIISLGAQKSILQITEGKEQDPYTSGSLFYRELKKSAFQIYSCSKKVLPLLKT